MRTDPGERYDYLKMRLKDAGCWPFLIRADKPGYYCMKNYHWRWDGPDPYPDVAGEKTCPMDCYCRGRKPEDSDYA